MKRIKKVVSLITSAAMIFSFTFMSKPTIVNASEMPAAFVKGADVGWLPQMEASNFIFKDDNGNQKDCLQILKDHGIDSIRLRTWVNPSDDPQSGHCSTQETVNMAVRAKNMGFKIMIDFHYSDSWADPGQQNIPTAWKNDDLTQMKTDLYSYTYDVMTQLKNNGVTPEWVQVGNEINPGMLLPMGSVSTPSNLAQLINSGYDAVKAVSPTTKVIIHRANGYDNAGFRKLFDALEANGAEYDVIGVSYYPGDNWTSTIDALGDNLNDMASRYGKEVMVVEVGGDCSIDSVNVHNMLLAVQNKVLAVPNSKGIGVFYWEPEGAKSWSRYSMSAWNGYDGKSTDGEPTKALDAFLPGEEELNPYPVTGIKVDQESASVEVGNTVTLKATLEPSNSTYKGIAFSSSDESIAKVDSSSGIIAGIATGTATITATSYDQHKTATCQVTVVPSSNLIKNPDFELDQASWTVTGNTASVTFENDSHKGAKALHYYNGNFEVSQTITGLENGSYKLSAWTSGGGGENLSEIFAENGAGQKFSQAFTNTGWDIWNQTIVNNIEVTDGKLTIGANVEMNSSGGQWGNIDDFMLVKNEDTSLRDLQVNGVTVKNFDPDVTSYDVVLPAGTTAVPTVTSIAMDSAAAADVTQADALPGHAKVTVTKGSTTKNYVINFTVEVDNPIKNSGFESSFDNWTISDSNAVSLSNDKNSGQKALGYWKATPYELTVSQKITGLKNGVYSLSAWSQGASDSCTNQIFAENSNTNRLTADIKNTGWAIWSKTTIKDIMVTDGTLTIGSYLNAPAGYWGSYDDFELIQTGTIDNKPIINSVVTTPASVTLEPGETKQLTAIVDADNEADETVTWSSSDTNNKVTVNQSGFVSVAEDAEPGHYKIKATSTLDESKFGTTSIIVPESDTSEGRTTTGSSVELSMPAEVKIEGTARVGETLTAELLNEDLTKFTTSSGVTYSWYRLAHKDDEVSNSKLVGNDETYKLTGSDKDYYIKLEVTYNDKTFEDITSKIWRKTSSSSSSSSSNSSSTTNKTITQAFQSAPTVTLITNADGTFKLIDGNGKPVIGWKQINGNWYFADATGIAETGWQLVNNKWYLMAPTGVMQIGWQQVSGKWYLLDKSGAMQTGWKEIDGKWYLLNNDGAMLTNWQYINGKWYYLYASGEMASDTAIDGYTLDSDGAWIQ